MPFCYSPWTNLDISPQGTLSPCCKFQFKLYQETYNAQTNDLSEYVESDFLRQVRQQFKQGHWPAGCERCKTEEDHGIASKRQLDYERWHEHYDQIDLESSGFITASVAFGNTCNLKCITCSSVSSSKWHQEYKDIYSKDFLPVHFYRKDFVSKFVAEVPDLRHLDVPGGEPFLSGVNEQKQLLQHYIDTNQAAQITLHYTTNVTVFPDQSWWTLWQHFKEIDLQLSIDGVSDHAEYIRFPCDWDTVAHNIDCYQQIKLPNFRLSVSHTLSAYNIFYLDEFFDWCYNKQLPQPWIGRTHNPEHMRPTVWPKEVREIIAKKLEQSTHRELLKGWIEILRSEDDSSLFDNFVKHLHKHDQYRNLNFMKTFPELASYI